MICTVNVGQIPKSKEPPIDHEVRLDEETVRNKSSKVSA